MTRPSVGADAADAADAAHVLLLYPGSGRMVGWSKDVT